MNPALVNAVVSSLSFGEEADVRQLSRFLSRDWQRTLPWLDHSGLTLYLLDRLKQRKALDVLPSQVATRFERNLADNRARVDAIASEVGNISDRLARAGVNHAVIKGLSLAPTFCPNPYLRTQCDLDFLIDKVSQARAQHVLEALGYEEKMSGAHQISYEKPLRRVPSRSDNPYSVHTTPMVELHVAMWDDSTHRVPFAEPEFRLDGLRVQQVGYESFPVLKDEDAFVLQMLHIFQHLLSYWVKPSWLWEVGYFLEKRRDDSRFWNGLDKSIRQVPELTDFSAIVVQLVTKTFAAPLPVIAQNWILSLRPATRAWLDHYGRSRLFVGRPPFESRLFPDSKVSLFLHRQYLPDPALQRSIMLRYLLPFTKPSTIAKPVKHKPSTRLLAPWRQGSFVFQRLIFHIGSGVRYLWELPRWLEMSRLASTMPHDDS